MKILQVNKFFYVRGGSGKYFFEVSKLLKFHGHKVAFFSMQDPQNQRSVWSKYFVSNISFEKVELKRFPRIFTRMMYSLEARRKISQLLDEFRPDIVHLHSIYHHISPSIIPELKKRKIPIVQTLHDYHLISPSHTLFHNGKICELTQKHKFYKAVCHKCVKNSYPASILEMIEQYLHHITGIYTNNVDLFISPSQFMAEKLIEYGIPKNKIHVLHNFCDYRKFKPHYKPGDYLLYFGRLSPEKGLAFLLDVMYKLPDIKLKIVGKGLQEAELKRKARVLELNNVTFLGYQTGDSLKNLIYNCRFVVLPSLSYDIFPISIMEAYACGKPAVASRTGGIPELVSENDDGYLFEPGNVDECTTKIRKLWSYLNTYKRLGKNSREFVMKEFCPDSHYKKLIEIYKNVQVR